MAEAWATSTIIFATVLVGVLVLILFIYLTCVVCYVCKRKKEEQQQSQEQVAVHNDAMMPGTSQGVSNNAFMATGGNKPYPTQAYPMQPYPNVPPPPYEGLQVGEPPTYLPPPFAATANDPAYPPAYSAAPGYTGYSSGPPPVA